MSGKQRKQGEDGSATLWAVGGIAALCLVAVAVLTYGAVVQTGHRATAAADLAALAGAGYAPYGEQTACDRVRWVADEMRVHVTDCRLRDWDVFVEVSAGLPGELTRFGAMTARSRAGPADQPVTSDDSIAEDQQNISSQNPVHHGRRMADG
jgi:secretion/DNA translocation related TadE-like protein